MPINKLLVKSILKNPLCYTWSIQGFGMLRMYLDDEVRLHIWDSKYQITNVSIIHNHPWNFTSHVIAGRVCNHSYVKQDANLPSSGGKYWQEEIITGEEATATPQSKTKLVTLHPSTPQIYYEGDQYRQNMDDLHKTEFADGAVTIIERDSRKQNNHAYSLWPEVLGKDGWVSAAPRPAGKSEIESITKRTLERWF